MIPERGSEMICERYAVCVFPSKFGDPWWTDRYWVAWIWFHWRNFRDRYIGRMKEVRLIDYSTVPATHVKVS